MSAPTLAAEEKGEGGEHEPEVLGQQHDEPVKPSSLSAAPPLIVQTPQLPHYKNAVAPDGTQRYVTLQLKLLCAGINFFHRHIRTDKDVKHRMRENRAFAHFFEEQYHAGKVEHGLPHVFRTSVHDTSALHVSSFILSILHQGIFSVSAFIIAIIYLSRFKECSHITLHATTWRPLFLVTLLLADKMWEDKPVRNSSLAKLFPVLSNKELNLLENFMLKQLGFNVLVKPDLFCSFCEKLLAEEVHAEIVQQALMSDFGQGLIAEPFCVRQPKELQAKLHDVGMEDTNFGTYITETCLKDEYLPRELWSLMLHSKGMAVCHATTSAGGPVAANGMIKSSSGAASDAADAAVPATAASASTGGVNNATTTTLSTSSVAGAPSITGGVTTVTSAAAAPSQLTTLTAGGVVVGTTLPGSTVAPRPASVNPSVGGRRAASTDPTRPQKAEVRSGSQRPGMLKMPGQFTFLKTPFNMVRKSLPATTKRSGPASNDPTRPQQGQQTGGQPQATTTTVFGAPTPTAPLPGFLTRPRIGLARQPSPFGTALRPVSAAPLRPGVGVFSQQQQQQPIATSRGGATSSEQAEGGGGSASGTTARAAGASSSKESAGAFVHDVLTDSRKGVDNNAVPDHLGTSVGSRGSKQSAGGVSAGGPQDFVHVAGHRNVWNHLPEGVVDTQDPLSGTLSIAVAPPVVSATAAAAGSYENRYKASPLSGPSKPLITKPSGSGSMVRPHAGDSSVNAEALSGNASASASASYSEHALGAGVGCVTTSTTGINSSSTSVSAVGGVSSVGGSSSSSASHTHQPAIIHLATATKQYSNTSAPPAVGMTAGTPESMPGAGSTSSASRGPPRGMAAVPQHVGGAVYATSLSSSSNMLLGGVVGSKFGTGAGFGTGPTLVGGGVRQRNWSVGRGAAVGRGGAVIPNRNIGVIVGGGMGHGGSAGANAAGGGSMPGAMSEGGAANPHFASGGMTTAASASTSSATIKAEPAMTPPLASQQQRSSSLGRFGFSQPRLNMQLGGRVNGRIPGVPVAKLQAFTPTAASARGHTPTPHAAEQNGDASTSYQHQLSTSSSSSSAAGEARTTGAATGYVPPARAASAPRVVGGGAAYQHFASTTQKGNHGAKQASGYVTPTHPSMVMMMTSSGGTAPGGHLLSAATPPRPGPAQMQLGQPMLRGMSPFQTRIDASAGGGIGNAAHQVGVGGGGLLLVNPPFRGRSPSIRAVHMSAGGAGAAHAAATGLGLGTATPAAPAPPVA